MLSGANDTSGAGVAGARRPAAAQSLDQPPGAASSPLANGRAGSPGPFGPAESGGEVTSKPKPAGRGALRNWRVRSRLLLLVVIPTASAIALGGVGVYSSGATAFAYQRVQTLATLGQQIVNL